MPWHDTEEEAVAFVKAMAQAIAAGETDPFVGASDLWHSALLIRREAPWPYLNPFADLADAAQAESPEKMEPGEAERCRAEIVAAAQRLVDAEVL